MTVKYVYRTNAIVTFDDLFTFRMTESLDKIVEVVSHYMHEYGFYKAIINDNDTKAILVSITDS